MSKIDWDKAPEGAEFWCEEQWFKNIDGEWFTWYPGALSWAKPAYKSPDNFSWWGAAVARPSPAWSGEGLPPVGVVCEVRQKTPYESSFEWEECRIAMINTGADGLPQVCTIDKRGDFAIYYPATDIVEFRPIRTPEQIAADEREAAVNGMLCYDALGGSRRGLAEALYDAGFRKI